MCSVYPIDAGIFFSFHAWFYGLSSAKCVPNCIKLHSHMFVNIQNIVTCVYNTTQNIRTCGCALNKTFEETYSRTEFVIERK